ncbi:MAG: hydrogenase maturation protease [Chloroflexota bacterium]
MSGTLIIAIGNPLRGDDGVAWHVVDELFHRDLPEGTCLLTVHQLLPELAQDASEATRIIFIDASMEHQPGETAVIELTQSPLDLSRGTHELDPQGLLALTTRLFDRSPTAYLVAIGGKSFGFSESLSPVVEAAVPVAADLVVGLTQAIPGIVSPTPAG